MTIRPGALAGLALAAACAVTPARAARSYDNCTGFIDSLPATITTAGTWCLRKDLNTAVSSGQAILVASNNVTVDCNDFRIGGLPAGAGTQAWGINAEGRLNITVRNCSIRGFLYGIRLRNEGGGHLVEDNRLDGNTSNGISIEGEGNLVRGNRILNTGGSTAPGYQGGADGIVAYDDTDIIDNEISGVGGAGTDVASSGIVLIYPTHASVRGNRIRGLTASGAGSAVGIHLGTVYSLAIFRDNEVVGPGAIGISCAEAGSRAQGNTVVGFTTPIANCRDDGNSL